MAGPPLKENPVGGEWLDWPGRFGSLNSVIAMLLSFGGNGFRRRVVIFVPFAVFQFAGVLRS
jgi:hypothetical protein